MKDVIQTRHEVKFNHLNFSRTTLIANNHDKHVPKSFMLRTRHRHRTTPENPSDRRAAAWTGIPHWHRAFKFTLLEKRHFPNFLLHRRWQRSRTSTPMQRSRAVRDSDTSASVTRVHNRYGDNARTQSIQALRESWGRVHGVAQQCGLYRQTGEDAACCWELVGAASCRCWDAQIAQMYCTSKTVVADGC